jgi:hypothetical protein
MTGKKPFLGIGRRTWVWTGIVLAFCAFMYAMRVPPTPNDFDQSGAQIPNKLRSSWGVEHPL